MASILSLAFWGYFYCFCLLYIIVKNDILQRVLLSVTKNGKFHLSGSRQLITMELFQSDYIF